MIPFSAFIKSESSDLAPILRWQVEGLAFGRALLFGFHTPAHPRLYGETAIRRDAPMREEPYGRIAA